MLTSHELHMGNTRDAGVDHAFLLLTFLTHVPVWLEKREFEGT